MTGKRQRAAEKLVPQRHKDYLTDQDAREIVARHFSEVIDREARKRCDNSLKNMSGIVSEGIRFVRVQNLDGQATSGSVDVVDSGEFHYEPKPGWTGTDTFSFEITDGRLFSRDLVFQVQVNVLNSRQFTARKNYRELKTRENDPLRAGLPFRKEALYRLYQAQEKSKLASDLQGIINLTVLEAINAGRLSGRELREWLRMTNTAARELLVRLTGRESGGEAIAPQVLAAMRPFADRAAADRTGGHEDYGVQRVTTDGYDWVEYGSDVHLAGTLRRVREVAEWSDLAMNELTDIDHSDHRQFDLVTADVVSALAGYWKEQKGLIPTCSVPRKKSTKPSGYAAFATEVLGKINISITPAILRNWTLVWTNYARR